MDHAYYAQNLRSRSASYRNTLLSTNLSPQSPCKYVAVNIQLLFWLDYGNGGKWPETSIARTITRPFKAKGTIIRLHRCESGRAAIKFINRINSAEPVAVKVNENWISLKCQKNCTVVRQTFFFDSLLQLWLPRRFSDFYISPIIPPRR